MCELCINHLNSILKIDAKKLFPCTRNHATESPFTSYIYSDFTPLGYHPRLVWLKTLAEETEGISSPYAVVLYCPVKAIETWKSKIKEGKEISWFHSSTLKTDVRLRAFLSCLSLPSKPLTRTISKNESLRRYCFTMVRHFTASTLWCLCQSRHR